MVYYPNTIVVDGVLPKDYLSDMEAAQTGRGTERAGRSSSEDRLPLASIVTGRMSSWLKLVIIVFKSSSFLYSDRERDEGGIMAGNENDDGGDGDGDIDGDDTLIMP